MTYVHYSSAPLKRLDPNFDYKIRCSVRMMSKPEGLWFSVESYNKDGWKDWCINEKFNADGFEFAYQLHLKQDAVILHLKTDDEIIAFSKVYCTYPSGNPFNSEIDSWKVDWGLVRMKFQCIIIAPYQFDCRFHEQTMWYYGWDCASGCIWDISAIERIELLQDNSMPNCDSTYVKEGNET